MRAFSLITATVLACCLPSRLASAQGFRPDAVKITEPSKEQLEEAKERYEKGVKLYDEEGNVPAALVEFERAYELAPNYKVLYNIGQGARTLRDYATSLRAFEAYLAGGKDKIPKPRAADVARDIAQLRTFVATLTVEVDAEGAALSLDGAAVGTSPLKEPLLVNAGRSTLTATKAGRVATVSVNVAGGDVRTVRLELPTVTRPEDAAPPPPPPVVAPPPAAPAPAPIVEPREAVTPDRTVAYLAFGIGGALVVGAGVTGYSALRASNDLEKKRFAGPRPSTEAETLQDRTKRLSLVSDVLSGAALVSVSVGVVLLVLEPKRSAAAAHGKVRSTSAVMPYLTTSGAGVSGAF